MSKKNKIKLSTVLPAMADAIIASAENDLANDDMEMDIENMEDYSAIKLNEIYSTLKEEILDRIAIKHVTGVV